MPIKRADVVSKAREYLGTKFGHQGRVKGLALDCVGLPLCVAGELGLKGKNGETLDGNHYNVYTRQPLGDYVLDMCKKLLTQKPIRLMQPGDVLSLRVETAACHVGIVSEVNGVLSIIHAYDGGVKKCVEHELGARWKERIAGCFRFPEVTD